MVYQTKILVVVSILAFTAVFLFRNQLRLCLTDKEIGVFKKAWFLVTFWGIFAPQIWVLLGGMAAIVFFLKRNFQNDPVGLIGLFLVCVFAIPNVFGYLPGIGPIYTLFKLDTVALCSMIILLPLLKSSLKKGPLFSFDTDKYVLGYYLLVFMLDLRAVPVTEVGRQFINNFFEGILPYLVISRNLTCLRDHHRVIGAMVFMFAVMTLIAAYEAVLKQYLYTIIKFKYRLVHPVMLVGNYRAGFLRSMGVIASPISLGIFMGFLVSAVLYLNHFARKNIHNFVAFLLAIMSLIFTFARGSWVGSLVSNLLYVLRNERAFGKFFKLGVYACLALIAISFTPYVEKLEELLPAKFRGEEAHRTDTFDYRSRLLENSIIVIKESPGFGNSNFLSHPAMQEMKQGQGIIDVVNTYLSISLNHGLVTLVIFLLAILPNMWKIYSLSQKLPEQYAMLSRYSKFIAFTMLGVLIMIYNMSPLGYLRLYIWVLIALQASLVKILWDAYKTKPSKEDPDAIDKKYSDDVFEDALAAKLKARE